MGDVGRRLRWSREIVAESQADVCRLLGLEDTTTWNKWEKGTRYPDVVVMARYCDLFGLTMDYLYRGRLKGIREDVQLRLAAHHPELVDQDPELSRPAKVKAPAA